MHFNLTESERLTLEIFDDAAATILVLQRDGFTCRANENLMDNFVRHVTLFFGGIMQANGRLQERELHFFKETVTNL